MGNGLDEASIIPIPDDPEVNGNESFDSPGRYLSTGGSTCLALRDRESTRQEESTVEPSLSPSSSLYSTVFKSSSFSLPILRSVEVVPPVARTNYLDALMKTDPRVAFDALHLGLLEYIVTTSLPARTTKEYRKRKRSASNDNCSVIESSAPFEMDGSSSPHSEIRAKESSDSCFLFDEDEMRNRRLPSLTSTTLSANATSDVVVEVHPFHKMLSERQPFKVHFKEIETVLQTSKKNDVKALVGEQLLNVF